MRFTKYKLHNNFTINKKSFLSEAAVNMSIFFTTQKIKKTFSSVATQKSSLLLNKNLLLDTNLQEKFVNLIMKNGKKSKAYTIFYQSLKLLYIKNVFFAFKSALFTDKIDNLFKSHFSIFKLPAGLINYKKIILVKLNSAPTMQIALPIASFDKNKQSLFLSSNSTRLPFCVAKQEKKNPIELLCPLLCNAKNQKNINLLKYKVITKSFYVDTYLAWQNNGQEKKFIKIRQSQFAEKLLLQAIENVQPSVEVRSVKVSGRTYQVPAIVSKKRQQVLAIKWIIDLAKKKQKNSNINFSECLALELFEALKKSGKAKQKRDLLHQLAESNRAYMRFKWW